tara:strand:+ start:585 stop:1208 length:624 start_codon:yes stop_codon:yes gene_type:complete
MGFREAILKIPFAYRTFALAVGRFGLSRLELYAKYLPYTPGTQILDLGCGTGNSTSFFQPQDYLGIDISQRYVKSARIQHPNHRFECIDFRELKLSSNIVPDNGFGVVLAYGLMHHLDDNTSFKFFQKAYELMPLGGHIVCFDGCIYQGQNTIKQKLILKDRGEFIRTPEQLTKIAHSAGFECQNMIEENSLIIPYSLLALSGKRKA